jgi:hypothetical protein
MTQDAPERAEVTRLGYAVTQRSGAVACVTAIPTTTAAFTLWNGEAAGGKLYIIDSINWTCTTSAAAASMFSLVVMIPVATFTAAPTTADTVVADSLSGRTYAGKGVMSHSVTVTDNGWWSIGNTFNSTLTATVGAQIEAPVNGAIVLAPGYILCIACVAANTTAVGKVSVKYFEVPSLPAITV